MELQHSKQTHKQNNMKEVAKVTGPNLIKSLNMTTLVNKAERER